MAQMGAAVVLVLAALVAWWLGGGVALAAGWLAGWLFCLSVTTGAALWFLIVALTGGEWIGAGARALAALAAATPLVALAGVLFLPAAPELYPWWQGPEAFSLTPALFGIRLVAWLVIFSAIGVAAPRGLPRRAAALALVLYVPAISLAGTDWLLSRDPRFGTTLIGVNLAAVQLTLGLAAGAAAGLKAAQRQAVLDWGGLMLATVLGTGYLFAMQYLVLWTGNLPADAAWYETRAAGGGAGLRMLTFLPAGLLPFAGLLSTRQRGSSARLRLVGVAILTGGLAHFLWFAAPGVVAAASLAAVATVGLLALAALALSGRRRMR
jgi:hypothetical protein